MQRSSQRCSRDWNHASLRHERYNDLKHFNKVGYVLSYTERPKVTRPTGFGEPPTLLLFFS
eukprot:13402496-Heterocapsa_arctica.AAC.1